jgi:hypothetical protein
MSGGSDSRVQGRLVRAIDRLCAAYRDYDDAMKVWRFEDAPEELRRLSEHGGDEDWILFVPSDLWDGEVWPLWAAEGTPFGPCSVSHHRLADGSRVLIGAHA